MKIFISWSGEVSKSLAEIFREWLPLVIQAIKPYFSALDIEKGARWSSEIAKELDESKLGLILLTQENLDAPWIMFEAGALSKNLNQSKVCPILFDLEPGDIQNPLAQFQASRFGKEEIYRLITMINDELQDRSLSLEKLQHTFDKWWPDLEQKVGKVMGRIEHPDFRRIPPLHSEHRHITKSLFEYAFESREEVFMISIMSQHTLRDMESRLQKAHNTGTKVNILTLDPLNPLSDGRAIEALRLHLNEFTHTPEATAQQIVDAWEQWSAFGRKYTNVKIRKYKSIPTLQGVLVDRKYMLVELLPYDTHTGERPGLFLSPAKDPELFKLLRDRTIRLWNASKE